MLELITATKKLLSVAFCCLTALRLGGVLRKAVFGLLAVACICFRFDLVLCCFVSVSKTQIRVSVIITENFQGLKLFLT